MATRDEMDVVDLKACKYEWICPACKFLNIEHEITDIIYCEACYVEYKVGQTEHAFH